MTDTEQLVADIEALAKKPRPTLREALTLLHRAAELLDEARENFAQHSGNTSRHIA